MQPVLITDVLHVPSLSNNLLSVLSLTTRHGFKVNIENRTMSFTVKKSLVFTATVNKTMTAYLDSYVVTSTKCTAYCTITTMLDRTLLHRRLCHLGKDRLEQMICESLSADLPPLNSPDHLTNHCESYINGKQHCIPFPHDIHHATGILDRVFSDLHGPMPVQGHGGAYCYWAVFISDAMR